MELTIQDNSGGSFAYAHQEERGTGPQGDGIQVDGPIPCSPDNAVLVRMTGVDGTADFTSTGVEASWYIEPHV